MVILTVVCGQDVIITHFSRCVYGLFCPLTALMMAEAKQREKERRKLLREQERAARLEQLRVEREVRAQQYLEVWH